MPLKNTTERNETIVLTNQSFSNLTDSVNFMSDNLT